MTVVSPEYSTSSFLSLPSLLRDQKLPTVVSSLWRVHRTHSRRKNRRRSSAGLLHTVRARHDGELRTQVIDPSASCLTPICVSAHFSFSPSWATSCNVNGIIGVRKYTTGTQFWKHHGFLPLHGGDLPVDVFTFGGGASAPLDDGAFFGSARVVARITVGADAQTTEPMLQLFVNEVRDSNQLKSSMPLLLMMYCHLSGLHGCTTFV